MSTIKLSEKSFNLFRDICAEGIEYDGSAPVNYSNNLNDLKKKGLVIYVKEDSNAEFTHWADLTDEGEAFAAEIGIATYKSTFGGDVNAIHVEPEEETDLYDTYNELIKMPRKGSDCCEIYMVVMSLWVAESCPTDAEDIKRIRKDAKKLLEGTGLHDTTINCQLWHWRKKVEATVA